MPRLRKLRKKQKYQYHVNRTRLNKKMKKFPRINCDEIRNAWDRKKSMNQNLESMGLVADPNKLVTPPKSTGDVAVEPTLDTAQKLQDIAKETFVKKRSIAHLLPPDMVKKLTTFLDKHGEDYEGMAKDPTNFYQETAAQLRSQINRLKKTPQQWVPYVKSRGLISTQQPLDV